jgi:hypothetical protein
LLVLKAVVPRDLADGSPGPWSKRKSGSRAAALPNRVIYNVKYTKGQHKVKDNFAEKGNQ